MNPNFVQSIGILCFVFLASGVGDSQTKRTPAKCPLRQENADKDFDISIEKEKALIRFTAKDLKRKAARGKDHQDLSEATVVIAKILNLPNGLKSLRPLVEANVDRFKNFCDTRKVAIDFGKQPRDYSLMIRSAEVIDDYILFKVDVHVMYPQSWFKSTSPEVWRLKNGVFKLQKHVEDWHSGG